MLDYVSLGADLSDEEWMIHEIPRELMRHIANMSTINTYEGAHDIHTLIRRQDCTDIAAFD